MNIKRWELFLADLSPVIGSEQDGVRPVLIIQNNVGNRYAPTVIAIPITTKVKHNIPTHIPIRKNKTGLQKDSIILVEQIRTIDKKRLIEKIGAVDSYTLDEVRKALKISLNIRGEVWDVFDNNW